MMKRIRSIHFVTLCLILLPTLLVGVRVLYNEPSESLRPTYEYEITYHFDIESHSNFWIKSFLPQSDAHQKIKSKTQYLNDNISQSSYPDASGNLVSMWLGKEVKDSLHYSFYFQGLPIKYQLDSSLHLTIPTDEEFGYTLPSLHIQSTHSEVEKLAKEILNGQSLSLVGKVKSFYDYVYAIPSASTSELYDAIKTIHAQSASCNGKSRLLVALLRNQGIPSRVTGGLILENTSKKTSHLWVEVKLGNQWVPFDALNGHFAYLPAHYLQLYVGDEYLIKRNKNLIFDYQYEIKKIRVGDFKSFALINLWGIIDETELNEHLVKMLLLLPLGGFIVTIFKNVIGLKTYGVFLPVLISLSLIETGLFSGLLLFNIIVLFIALLNFPLEHWKVQYTSKISVLLIGVILMSISIVGVLVHTQWLAVSAPLFFPIIILTMISEKIAKKAEEEGLQKALMLYLTTLIVTLMVYFILSSSWVQNFLVTFPEILLTVAGLNLTLGRWVGLRLTEYYRFYRVIN